MGIRNESLREPDPAGGNGPLAQPLHDLHGEHLREPLHEPLPDLLTLDLAELGSVDHPVLREVLDELRARAAEPSETLWGFDNSF